MAAHETMNNTTETSEYPTANEDFFRHVNGEWLATTEIPGDKARWGTYDIIGERTTERLKSIIDEVVERDDLAPGNTRQQVRDYYLAVTDMDQRNELGATPLGDMLGRVHEIANGHDALELIAEFKQNGLSPFFHTSIDEDRKNAGHNILYIEQDGLNLPGKQSYFDDDEKSRHVREEYDKYRRVMFQMLGRHDNQAAEAAEGAYQIELALARVSQTPTEERDIEKNYFKYTREQATAEFPDIDWDAFFTKLGAPDVTEFVIKQPDYMTAVGELLKTAELRDIKAYLELQVISGYAGSFSEEFSDAQFAFYGETLSGIKEQAPLWKKAVSRINNSTLEDAIGPLYCERYFDNASKVKLTEMVADVKAAFRERVEAIDWMTDETKTKTLEKLNAISFKMGYPDTWRDISSLEINPDNLVQNILAMCQFEWTERLADLNRPYDKSRWHMSPTTVNACSDLKREMTFPAAVLQDPFFDPAQDDAYNYGAIGCTMGHELTHFFDDKGCKFDVDGNMNNWWSNEDREAFSQLTDKFVEYFGNLSADGNQVNGRLTLGENIADVAGVKIAYMAYQKKLARDGNAGEIIDGMTPEQRFFTGWARKWAGKITPELATRYNQTDPHSPSEVRVNGVLAITPEFHAAFGLNENDAMYVAPENQPKLW